MDAVSEAVGAELTCVLIGERPGLATGESMSCYMTYKAYRYTRGKENSSFKYSQKWNTIF